jgi:acyl-CoA thioesterase YciA
MTNQANDRPKGELTLRTLAMPADTNAAGDIFGGWVMSQMDLASGIRGAEVERPMTNQANDRPKGELTLRTLAMPADTNAAGDIFGGWVMSQMDLASGITRRRGRRRPHRHRRGQRDGSFQMPVKVGDTLCVYTEVERVGTTSMVLRIEAWAQRYLSYVMEKVTDARFTMVKLDAKGKPSPIQR